MHTMCKSGKRRYEVVNDSALVFPVAYKLTLNNDGEPFPWTSNVQLISKVYLKKHTSQPRTYNQTSRTPKWFNMPSPRSDERE